MRNKYPELTDEEWYAKILAKCDRVMNEEHGKKHKPHKDYIGVLYLKYAECEYPVLGRYFAPEGHKYYRRTFSEAMADCVKRGLIYQGRLWDAYEDCDKDISISRRKKNG